MFCSAFRHTRIALVLSAALAAAPATAQSVDPVQQHNSNAVWFENWIGLSNAALVVETPEGAVIEVFAESGTPVFELDRGSATDGVYRYELRAASKEQRKIVNAIDNGRGDAQRDSEAVPFYTTGFFIVERGAIITPEAVEEEKS